MKKFHLYTAMSLLVLGMAISAHAADESHPTIHNAITALEHTKTELESGEYGFGGHRSQAIEHIDAALKELHLALDYAHDHPDEIKAPAKQ
jgi:hypothetical protein